MIEEESSKRALGQVFLSCPGNGIGLLKNQPV